MAGKPAEAAAEFRKILGGKANRLRSDYSAAEVGLARALAAAADVAGAPKRTSPSSSSGNPRTPTSRQRCSPGRSDRMAGQGSSSIVDLDATIRLLAPRLLRYGIARTGDPAIAEEVAQESLTAYVRRCHTSRPPDSAEAFVFAVARRRIGRAIWRRRLFVPLEHLAAAYDGRANPETEALARAEQARVRAALARLPRHDRDALLLVAVGELRSAEAAAALGVSLSALKMRVHRARRRLAGLLEDHHDRPGS
jgi:RNA polymerase sigma factor (sigma-70 family)